MRATVPTMPPWSETSFFTSPTKREIRSIDGSTGNDMYHQLLTPRVRTRSQNLRNKELRSSLDRGVLRKPIRSRAAVDRKSIGSRAAVDQVCSPISKALVARDTLDSLGIVVGVKDAAVKNRLRSRANVGLGTNRVLSPLDGSSKQSGCFTSPS